MCLTANAETTVTYKKCGNCEIIVSHYTNWLGADETTYGLAKNGVEILSPDYEVFYDEKLHLLVFRGCASEVAGQYQIMLFSADSGKCLYSGRYFAKSYGDVVPWMTFENKGKYSEAVIHYYSSNCGDRKAIATKTVGSFFRKDGKLYQVKQRQVDYEAPVE
jgi:hypothetical protein